MIGHILLIYESCLVTIIEGDIEGYIERRKPHMEYMTSTMKDENKETYTWT